MNATLTSSNIRDFYIALSVIGPTDLASSEDKKRIAYFAQTLLSEIRFDYEASMALIPREHPFSLSLIDKIHLQAAKNKFEQLVEVKAFKECIGTSRVVSLVRKLFFHPTTGFLLRAGYAVPSTQISQENLKTALMIYKDPKISDSLRTSCWMMINKVIDSDPNMLFVNLNNLSDDLTEFVSLIECIYTLIREKRSPESFRHQMVWCIIKGLQQFPRGRDFRDRFLSLLHPTLKDLLLADYVKYYQLTFSYQTEYMKQTILTEILELYHLGYTEPSLELDKIVGNLFITYQTSLINCIPQFWYNPRVMALFIESSFRAIPDTNRLKLVFEMVHFFRRYKKDLDVIHQARNLLSKELNRQVLGGLLLIPIDSEENRNSLFDLLFSTYSNNEEQLLAAVLNIESLIDKGQDLVLVKFLLNLGSFSSTDPNEIAYLLETLTKIIDRCRWKNVKKQIFFYRICNSFKVKGFPLLKEAFSLMDPLWARKLLSDRVYDLELSSEPFQHKIDSLTLSCSELLMMQELHPDFFILYLSDKDPRFLNNFIKEMLVILRQMHLGLKTKYFQKVPENTALLYAIGSDLAIRGNFVEAAEILPLLDLKEKKQELAEFIFKAHLTTGNLPGAEKLIRIGWTSEEEQFPYWKQLVKEYIAKELFSDAMLTASHIYPYSCRDVILFDLFIAYLGKGDITQAELVIENFSTQDVKLECMYQLVKKCISLNNYKKGKEIAILMDHDEVHNYRNHAFLSLIENRLALKDRISANGLLWCMDNGECKIRATELINLDFAARSNEILHESINMTWINFSYSDSLDKKAMKEVYFSLGEEKWREGIDGEHQKHGSLVYDKGLHGGKTEPGFMQSMQQAFVYMSNHLGYPTTASFYLELHKVVCNHFRGTETNTLMGQDKIGVFRDKDMDIYWDGLYGNHAITNQARRTFQGLKLGTISRETMRYKKMDDFEVEHLFDWFLKEYYDEIHEASTPREKLTAIGKFTQRCQWLHAPKDGCGRTDTLILNKHLVENGFHPVVLEFPYKSSILPLHMWIDYLEEGLKKWEEFQPKSPHL
jgi:hypothetical protein